MGGGGAHKMYSLNRIGIKPEDKKKKKGKKKAADGGGGIDLG